MKISEILRKALPSRRRAAVPRAVRPPEDPRAAEAARAWERPGGPIDPGFVA